jgi:UDP-N-acetylmuramoyl-L-alanyl-D-glutamate--2,6-diaminopimelate ligase
MKLGELVEGLYPARGGALDREVLSVTPDSKRVTPGALFVAVPGTKLDGHAFIPEAVERGAIAVVGQDLEAVPGDVTAVQAPDSRVALAQLAARFYGEPSRDLLVVAVTGTNGKTTTAYLVEAMLREAGLRVGVIGTVEYRWDGRRVSAPLTTPDPADLHALLARMREEGCDAVVMEVSSHALAQGRLEGCDVDIGVFTNLTQDHLDFHGTMDRYFEAKARLFSETLARPETKRPRWAVVNAEDRRANDLLARTACRAITYGIGEGKGVSAWNVRAGVGGISAEVVTPEGAFNLRSPLVGEYNLSNHLAAAAVGTVLGLRPEVIRRGLASVTRVPGRMDRVGGSDDPPVFVDYAHTPDALGRVLEAAARLAPGGLIAVFGCGGDRDRSKRAPMGEAAARRARLAIVTSDNPRTEDPLGIIMEILAGVEKAGGRRYEAARLETLPPEPGYVVIPDRREAIRLACRLAASDRVVVIAGKGHEDYQIVGGVKHPFSDHEEVAKALGATPVGP